MIKCRICQYKNYIKQITIQYDKGRTLECQKLLRTIDFVICFFIMTAASFVNFIMENGVSIIGIILILLFAVFSFILNVVFPSINANSKKKTKHQH